MNSIVRIPSLVIAAEGQIFKVMKPQTVHVGTNPPSADGAPILRFRHPKDFCVTFQPHLLGIWFASLTNNVNHHATTLLKGDHVIMDPPPLAAPSGPWIPLLIGIHIFMYDISLKFQALVPNPGEREGSILGEETIANLTTDFQRFEDYKATQRSRREMVIPKRVAMSQTPEGVDEHNRAVLGEDLREVLALPKARKRDAHEGVWFEVAWNEETGKLIGLIRCPYSSMKEEVVWPPSALVYPKEIISFDVVTHTFSSTRLDPIPRPLWETIKRAYPELIP